MNTKLKGGIFVFLGACSFGVLSTIVKFAYGEGYSLGEITGSQSFFGMSILWLLYWLTSSFKSQNKSDSQGQHQTESIKKTRWWHVCLAGTFTGIVGMSYYQCVNLLPASIAIILLMQSLWISLLLDYIFFKKKPVRIQLIAVLIVFIGTFLAGGVFDETIHLNPQGLLFGMLAALSYAIFILTSGRVGLEMPVLKKSALMITGSCALTWIIFPPLFFFNGVFLAGLYKWGLILALLGTIIPPLFFSVGMPKVGVSLGTILSAAELPMAILSSYFILQEDVNFLRWIGVVLILLSIAMTNIRLKKKELPI